MNVEELKHKTAKKKSLKISIIGNSLGLIGIILVFNQIVASKIMIILGFIAWIAGMIVFCWGIKMRYSEEYRDLTEEDVDSEMKDMVREYGRPLLIIGTIFILSIMLGALYFVFYWTHSWIKVLAFLIAFTLVGDVKDYFSLDKE